MKMHAICGALATALLVSPGAVAQTAHDFSADNPVAATFGGLFGVTAHQAEAEPPSAPDEARRSIIISPQSSERFMQSETDERGYIRTTVKGRAVLVDPRTRRIVQVLE
jgi:hypothetical protein